MQRASMSYSEKSEVKPPRRVTGPAAWAARRGEGLARTTNPILLLRQLHPQPCSCAGQIQSKHAHIMVSMCVSNVFSPNPGEGSWGQ